MSPNLWAALCAVAVAVLLVAERKDDQRLRAISKTTASCAFVACALAAGALGSTAGVVLVVALVLCLLGDLLLLSNETPIFLGGLVAFLLGHVGFGVMFVVLGLDSTWALGSLILVWFVLPLVGSWLLPQVKDSMARPVLAYMLVISTMVALAGGCAGATGRPVILVAAVMFFISDLAVARHRFVKPAFSNKVWGLPLYYGAQVLFALTPLASGG